MLLCYYLNYVINPVGILLTGFITKIAILLAFRGISGFKQPAKQLSFYSYIYPIMYFIIRQVFLRNPLYIRSAFYRGILS